MHLLLLPILQAIKILDITYSDPIYGPQHVVVANHSGGGGTYYVYINTFFRGQIVFTKEGWKAYIQSPVLSKDDIDAIIDAVSLDAMG